MSQSEIFDAVCLAADSLVLDGEAAWETALSSVEEMGAWDFDHYNPKRPGPSLLDLDSYNEILRQYYMVASVETLQYLLNSRESKTSRLGFDSRDRLRQPRWHRAIARSLQYVGATVVKLGYTPDRVDYDAASDQLRIVIGRKSLGIDSELVPMMLRRGDVAALDALIALEMLDTFGDPS